MGKRDFENVAAALKRAKPPDEADQPIASMAAKGAWQECCLEVGAMFAGRTDKFDMQLWLQNCGVIPPRRTHYPPHAEP